MQIVVEGTGSIHIFEYKRLDLHSRSAYEYVLFRSWAMVEGDEGGRIVFVKKGKLMANQLWRKDEGVLVEGAHSQQVAI